MAKNIAYKYDETGIFIIPQSKNMKEIYIDEEETFIKAIQTYSRKQLSKQEVIEIDEQIRGNSNNVQIKENLLINLIKKIPEKDKNKMIDTISKILSNNENLETISMMQEEGFIDKLNIIPSEKRKKTIEIMGKVVSKRKDISKLNTPQIKKQKVKTLEIDK